jgi:hypothetical protein
MTMTPRDWRDLASVYRAGSVRAGGWAMNTAMRQHAEILEAMAVRCEALAWRGGMSEKPLKHWHVHGHLDGPHSHRHVHAPGEHGRDIDDHGHGHEPEREVRSLRTGELM